MAQVVSHRPFTRIGLGSFPDLCVCVCAGGGGIWGVKGGRGGVLVLSAYFCPSQYHSTNTPNSSSSV